MKRIILIKTILAITLLSQAQSVIDTRSTNESPTFYNREVKFEFKEREILGAPGEAHYSGLMTFAPWADNTGGEHHQLNFNKGGIFYRTGLPEETQWNNWSKILTTDSQNNLSLKGVISLQSDLDALLTFNNTDNSWQYVQFKQSGERKAWLGLNSNNNFSIYKENGGNIVLGGANVGIGITNPTSKFHIKGNELGKSINDQSILTTIEGSVVGNNSKFQILNKRNSEGSEWHNTSLRLQRVVDVTPMAFIDFGIEGKNSSYGLAFGTRDGFDGTQNVRMFIEEDGNVGIGTTDTKGYKLAVAGKVIAEEVKVELQTNWPDYVFEENYDLPSLEETENYIKANGHLQNIPSAAEVADEGISLGEMNAMLLQKIEELTLYTIDQEKQIEADNLAIKKLINTVENLTNRFDQLEQK